MNGELYVSSSWETATTNVGMWGTINTSVGVNRYPLFVFRHVGSDIGFYGFDYNGTTGSSSNYFLVAPVTSFDTWYNLSMSYSATSLNYYINGNLVYQYSDPYISYYDTIGSIILNSYNAGLSYDVYWDNVGTAPVSEPPCILLLTCSLVGLGALNLLRKRGGITPG
jgi:hypothetical protein